MHEGHTGRKQGWSGGRGSEEKTWAGALIIVFQRNTGRGSVSWFSLNNFSRLWYLGAVSSCLVPGD